MNDFELNATADGTKSEDSDMLFDEYGLLKKQSRIVVEITERKTNKIIGKVQILFY
ncbi:hypothetical protein ACFQ4L_03230 [Lapidilactobacillus mulanensis]|uniref:Uncharacterized protein n=1 Tax=Lapidilactobacillus mulanensis TaxID=2485999 RepID=A0ABW4DM80_9LACO|nr:hypothetical protein [Lapidilactobacillus mulanensis]